MNRQRLGRVFALGAALVASAVTAAVLTVPTSATGAAASGAYRPYKLIEFNFCGVACRDAGDTADVEGGGTDQQKVDELKAKILSWQPQAVLLNEVCLNQVNLLTSSLAGTSWPMWAGSNTKTLRGYYVVPVGFSIDEEDKAGCGSSPLFGNAILVRTANTLSNPVAWDLNPATNPGQQPSGWDKTYRSQMCVTANDAPYATVLCVHHSNATDPDDNPNLRNQQAGWVAANPFTNYTSSGHPVVVGGDFNLDLGDPGLSNVYDVGGTGPYAVFEEADQCAGANPQQTGVAGCNEWTKDRGGDGNVILDRKFDYVFLRQAYFRPNATASTVNHSVYSDHGIYLAQGRECELVSQPECS